MGKADAPTPALPEPDAADADADAADGPRSPSRTTRVLKVVGSCVLAVAAVAALSSIYAYRELDANLETEDYEDVFVAPRPEDTPVDGDPIDILVMGSDSREGDNNIDGLTGSGNRSDTTILVHLSADRKRAYGVSIPRDALVERPDCRDKSTKQIIPGASDAMWNDAFGLGGPGCTVSQFEQLSGIRVESTVVVDFAGFKEMVDAVGGVTICVPETITDAKSKITLEEGEREVGGHEALDYVRIRSGVDDDGEQAIDGSDLGRIKRQQAFIAALSKKIVSSQTLANPVRLYGVLEAITDSVELSGVENLKELGVLGYQFRDIGTDKVQFLTIPWEYDPVDPNRVRLLPEGQDVWERLRMDRPLTQEQTSGALTAAGAPGKGGTGGKGGKGTGGQGNNGSGPSQEDAEAYGLCG